MSDTSVSRSTCRARDSPSPRVGLWTPLGVEHPLGSAVLLAACSRPARDLLTPEPALFDGDAALAPNRRPRCRLSSQARIYSPFGLTHGYGLGLEQYVSDAVTVLGHLGTGLQGSFLGYDAESDTLVAVTSNTQNPESTAIMALETLTAIAQSG